MYENRIQINCIQSIYNNWYIYQCMIILLHSSFYILHAFRLVFMGFVDALVFILITRIYSRSLKRLDPSPHSTPCRPFIWIGLVLHLLLRPPARTGPTPPRNRHSRTSGFVKHSHILNNNCRISYPLKV